MKLYATGFNAWNQLRFDGADPVEPVDYTEFTCVLQDDAISRPRPCLSYTLGESPQSDSTCPLLGVRPHDADTYS